MEGNEYPQDFTVTPAQARAWHRREAADCINENNAYAAVFHWVQAGDMNLSAIGSLAH